MKKTVPILLIFLTAGCGNSLKHSWNNFTAHYNTFYNARKSFKIGTAKVKQQPVQFYPDTLILPHRIPPLAGKEDFRQAEQDASQLLRRFPDSKWTHNALLLLGKSYYYQHKFYNAQQKFEKILEMPGKSSLKRQAILWKGRVLLNLHSYRIGVQFLSKSLNISTGKWQPQQKAKVHILMAENLAMLNKLDKAAALLIKALSNIHQHVLAGKTYFLLGQVLQKSGNFQKAFNAYNRVKKEHPDYVYSYWAGIKKVETARLAGRLQQAISIASAMAANNKNFHRRSEIYYQQGLIDMAAKRYSRAGTWFKKVLRNHEASNSIGLRNQSYFKLGILYSRYLKDYDLAVAYFDSASTQYRRTAPFGNNDQVRQRTSAYKRYAGLKKDIQDVDSLLKLGSLSIQELQKKLVLIRKRNRRKLRKSETAVQAQNSMLNNNSHRFNSSQPQSETAQYGFLNYKNSRLVRQEEQQFAAVWGGRPLTDNWRRKQTISGIEISDVTGKNKFDSQSYKNKMTAGKAGASTFDLTEIPRTEKDRKKLKNQRLSDYYQLGNLFFLSLNKPDSAAHYYHLVLEENPAGQVKPRTVYSLYQLFQANHQPDSACAYKHKILQVFPSSRYAKYIMDHSGEANLAGDTGRDSARVLLQKMQWILGKKDSLDNKEAALKLQKLALRHQQNAAAPAVYMKGIRKYIKFTKTRDSVKFPADSLQFASNIGHLYQGEYWDHVRSMLKEFLRLFPGAPEWKQVNMWLAVLKNPTSDNEIATCKELGIQPKIIGGKKQFLQSVKMPDKVKGMHISGIIRFRLTIQKDGSVSSIKLMSRPTNLGIEPVYVKAIQKSLHFHPVKVKGERVKVSCIVSFPIKSE